MIYEVGKAPILKQGQKVTAVFPDDIRVDGIIVGRSTTDIEHHPMYMIYCTDGTFPNDDYPYTTFNYPLSLTELR